MSEVHGALATCPKIKGYLCSKSVGPMGDRGPDYNPSGSWQCADNAQDDITQCRRKTARPPRSRSETKASIGKIRPCNKGRRADKA